MDGIIISIFTMGNWWKGVSIEKLRQAEIGLFESVGMRHDDLTITNVPIWQNSVSADVAENYIHEIRVRPLQPGLPKLVMIHGFGGGGAVFYKMIKHLRGHFEVITIDLLGQGMSGRPDYEIKHDFDSTIAYFTDSIHAWFEQSGLGQNGEKFTLLGHSMGGLYIGHYALKYPEHIERLVFMSSVGISSTPEFLKPDTILQALEGRMAGYGSQKTLDIMLEYPWTPFDFYRMSGSYFARRGLYNGLKRRVDPSIFESGETEINYLTTYVYQMMIRKKSSELCLNRIMMPFAYTRIALEPLLP